MAASVNLEGPRLIYFARRHPVLDADAFALRWRQHGALGMSLRRWRNVAYYAQCDRIAPGGDGHLTDCDGVAVVVFRDEASRLAHIADPEGKVTREDEKAIFAAPVRDFAVLTESTRLLPNAGPARVFLAVTRATGLHPGQFADWWCADLVPELLRGLSGVAGYTRNRARADGPNGAGVDFADEITCADPAATMALIHRSTAKMPHRIGRLALIPTRPHVLHDVTA